jgi:hypothetical protein
MPQIKTKVLLNQDTLKVVGVSRTPLSYEVEIKNVANLDQLQKKYQYSELEDKKKTVTLETGEVVEKQLYLLPQPDKEIITEVVNKVETIESTASDGTANEPIMLQITNKIPVLDDQGNQKTYQPVSLQETTSDVNYYGDPNEPVMIKIYHEDGTVTEEQKTNENGELLYIGLMPYGSEVKVFTTEIEEYQKEDSEGNFLYWGEVVEEVVEYELVTPLEVIEDDPEYKEGLEKAQEKVQKERIVKFNEEQSLFNYEDVAKYKEQQLLVETLYSNAILYEQMDKSLFNSSNADFSFDVVSIPVSGKLTSKAITLPEASSLINVYLESSKPLDIYISDDGFNFYTVDKNNEYYFPSNITSTYVKIENNTDKRIDVNALAVRT